MTFSFWDRTGKIANILETGLMSEIKTDDGAQDRAYGFSRKHRSLPLSD